MFTLGFMAKEESSSFSQCFVFQWLALPLCFQNVQASFNFLYLLLGDVVAYCINRSGA